MAQVLGRHAVGLVAVGADDVQGFGRGHGGSRNSQSLHMVVGPPFASRPGTLLGRSMFEQKAVFR
jgi:hypothetical protein